MQSESKAKACIFYPDVAYRWSRLSAFPRSQMSIVAVELSVGTAVL